MKKKFDFNKNRKNCFFLIAGPCVIESEKLNFETAEKLKEITEKHSIPFIFKSSLYKLIGPLIILLVELVTIKV